MAEALRLLKQRLKKASLSLKGNELESEFLSFEICQPIGITQVPLPVIRLHVIISEGCYPAWRIIASGINNIPKYQWLYINAMEDLKRECLFIYSFQK